MKTTLQKFIFFIAFTTFVINSIGQTSCLNAWYKLDGTATDYSGNNLNGTLVGTTPTTGHLGNANCALYFNGVSDKVNLPDDFDFPQRTVSVWFKADTFDINSNLVYSSDHANLVYGMTLITVAKVGGINQIAVSASGHTYIYNNAVTANTWYHAAITVGTSYIKFYINGVLKDSTQNVGTSHSMDGDNFAKLGTTRKNDRYFKGNIDEVRIYDCDLSNDEINQLYNSVKENKIEPTGILVYPNPATNYITIEIPLISNQKNYIVSIYNSVGQLLQQQRLDEVKSEINISRLAKGVYLVKLFNNENTVEKIIVKE